MVRTVLLFVPLGWLFARLWGLEGFWFTYPATEVLTAAVGFLFYRGFLRSDYVREHAEKETLC